MKNPSAFPSKIQAPFGVQIPQHGMTLRDYFAAKAMQSELISCDGVAMGSQKDKQIAELAARAYEMADAMLEYRDKSK